MIGLFSYRVDGHSNNQVIILQNLTTMIQLNPISTYVAEIQKKTVLIFSHKTLSQSKIHVEAGCDVGTANPYKATCCLTK